MTPNQQRAQELVTELLFGHNEKSIALEVNVAPSTICRIFNMERHPYWSVSDKLVVKLDNLATKTRKDYLGRIFQHIAMAVDACHNEGIVVDDTVQSEIRTAIAVVCLISWRIPAR